MIGDVTLMISLLDNHTTWDNSQFSVSPSNPVAPIKNCNIAHKLPQRSNWVWYPIFKLFSYMSSVPSIFILRITFRGKINIKFYVPLRSESYVVYFASVYIIQCFNFLFYFQTTSPWNNGTESKSEN